MPTMTSPPRRGIARLWDALAAHLDHSQRGITFVVFALAIVVLLGMVALGIDGGRLYDERRSAQNAADHAALTAAHASCVRGFTDAQSQAAGLASATENGYDNDGTTNVVEIAVEGSSAHTFTATVWTSIPSTFAVVIGVSQLETTTTALAAGSGCAGDSAGPGAIYAGGTCPSDKYGFDAPGSTQRVFGGVHTNSNANIGGSTNLFTELPPPDDPFTHVGTLSLGGSGNLFQAGYPDQVPMPDPVWTNRWAPGDVSGTGSAPPTAGSFLLPYYDLADANGTNNSNDTLFTDKVTAITKDGVYYTTHTDGMDITSITGSVRNVVLVAPNGPIKVSGSNVTLNPFVDASLPRQGILMISNLQKSSSNNNEKKCDEFTISISGSSSTWNGIIWAPGGLIEFSGSTNSAVNGTLISWAVRLNGSQLAIRYNADLFTEEASIVLLQ